MGLFYDFLYQNNFADNSSVSDNSEIFEEIEESQEESQDESQEEFLEESQGESQGESQEESQDEPTISRTLFFLHDIFKVEYPSVLSELKRKCK